MPLFTCCDHSSHYLGFRADRSPSFKRIGRADVYHRFDVDRGLELVELNESDQKTLQHISAVTQSYLKNHEDDLERCAMLITPRTSMQT